MITPLDYLPIIVAVISLMGTGATILAGRRKNNADVTKVITESAIGMIDELRETISSYKSELDRYKVDLQQTQQEYTDSMKASKIRIDELENEVGKLQKIVTEQAEIIAELQAELESEREMKMRFSEILEKHNLKPDTAQLRGGENF